MNNKASAPLVIGGISVGAIIFLLFRLWATGLVIDALEPEFEKALSQLNDDIVCIPEASSQGVEICISNIGDVIVDGKFDKLITISTDYNEICNINSGAYEYKTICTLKNIDKAKNVYLDGLQTQRTIIEATKIIGYINTLQNLRKPITTGFWFLKKVKYIPI